MVFIHLFPAMIITFVVRVTELTFFCLEVSSVDILACLKIDACSDIQLAVLQS